MNDIKMKIQMSNNINTKTLIQKDQAFLQGFI